jgi:RimJ/RimL family protein N-acetyltransferase
MRKMDVMTTPVIETTRLILRPPIAEDYEPWLDFLADAEVQHFLGGVQPRTVAWRGFCTMAGAWTVFGFAMFSVVEKASGRWIGRLGPWYPEGWPGPEVGWGLARAAWGKGYATEGAAAAID